MAALRRTLHLTSLAAGTRRTVAGREGGQWERKLGSSLARSLLIEIVPLKTPRHMAPILIAI